MNIFKRQKQVYVQYDSERKVRTLRKDLQGDFYTSDDMERLGYEFGSKLSDGEIAGLVRELENEKLDVILDAI